MTTGLAHAKINLALAVGPMRPDGLHEIATIYQRLELADGLTFEPADHLAVEGFAEDTLVRRALLEVAGAARTEPGWRVTIDKRIPVGAGLGGGSSDAATAIRLACRALANPLADDCVHSIARGLGADVPFFLLGGRALGIGKGDEIYPLPDVPKLSLVLVSPRNIHVPTPDAYRWLHAPELASLTKAQAARKLFEFCALCWSAQGAALSNDFEPAVFRHHPWLARIRRVLLQGGASEALLAGSGSAVFGIFPSPAKARRAVVGFPHDQTFVCETVSRARYARTMKIASVVV